MARSSRQKGAFEFQGFDSGTDILRGAVKIKKPPSEKAGHTGISDAANRTSAFMQRAARVARKSPEVMVKVSGGAKGKNHIKEHLAYVTRNGKLEATNERGEVISGREAVKDLAEEWGLTTAKKGPDTRNLVLSMPKGVDAEKVLRAAKTFADKTFAMERQYLIALHTDKDHPHVHLTLKRRGFDGKNLNPNKADLQQWREDFAYELRQLGVSAEATPRRARGVVVKGQKQAVYHMEQRREQGAGQGSKVQLQKLSEAVRELSGETAPRVRPWELKIKERQAEIRGAWELTAKKLEKTGQPELKKLAGDIRAFVADMPPVQTERDRLNAAARLELAKRAGHTQERGPDRGG